MKFKELILIRQPRVLIVDLNNFARYPTISVGLLAAILRNESFIVDVFSPLATGVNGVVREAPVPAWGLAAERVKFRSAMTNNPVVRAVREWATGTALHAPALARQTERVVREIADCLDKQEYDAVLVSSYLIYFDLCKQIAGVCAERNVPILLGGPYFAQPEVREEWLKIPGLSALVGGEVEPYLGELVRASIHREDLAFPGVWSNSQSNALAPPLEDLDRNPFPDFSDFPWDRYPNRIIPMATGRGCGWGACKFCSDITGSAGRSFRSRSPKNVLNEMAYQAERFDAKLFVFTDPKLNSDLDVWDGLLQSTQDRVPGARWIGAVHVDSTRPRNGLTEREFEAAHNAGMVRLTTGLESGSQRVLDLMRKGADVDVSSKAICDAAAAGISVRVTMIVGYPGETADDVLRTADYLRAHSESIERVVVNRFHIRTGTRFHREYVDDPSRFPEIPTVTNRHRLAVVEHDFGHRDKPYRRAIDQVLQAAHEVNRRPIRVTAHEFDGVM